MRLRLALVFVAGLAAAVGPLAQQTAPPADQSPRLTFRVDANYIEVDAIVTDAKGNFVRDLTLEDFEVLEDKRRQKIDVFGLVDIPVARADRPLYRPTAVEPDVATNEKDFEGRIYVLLLDSNHVLPQDTYLVKKAARQFIQEFIGPNDLAAVVHSQTGRMDDSREFTSSRPALIASVERFIGEKLRSKALAVRDYAIANAGRGFNPNESKDPDAIQRAAKARATLETITRVSRYLSGIRGRRKAVVLFSEGLDFQLADMIGPRNMSGAGMGESGIRTNPASDNTISESLHAAGIIDEMQTMFEAASRANVAIYSVDPRGVASESDTLIQMTGMPEGSLTIDQITAAAREELRRQLGTLRTFSEATGGIALVGTNDFSGGFRRIVEDNSAYYVLGYHATNLKHDGKFHSLTVRVKRPGLQVRARRGYYALKDANAAAAATPADPAVALLNSPMPVGGLGLRLTTSAVKLEATKARVHLTIEIDGRDVTLQEKSGVFTNNVTLSYAAVDMSGTIHATGRKTLDLAIKPETRQLVAEHGLRLVTEIDLPPGRHQLRLAGHDVLGGRAGSVFWDVEVPDFTASPLTMSHLLLTASSAGRTPTSFDAPGLKTLLPGPPTASRTFALEDTLAVFAEIYDNLADRLHTVDISATVRTGDGTQVFVTREERKSAEINAPRGGYGFLARIPLQDLVPGTFILTVEARSRLGGDPVSREIQFTIK